MSIDLTRTAAPANRVQPRRRVTDAPTRMFHALFALSFLGAYLSADSQGWRELHVTLGYTMAGLFAGRLLYGLFGPRQARLGLWWRRLASAPAWLRSLRRAPGGDGLNWRQGQNLLTALAVVAMLALVLPLTLSGYASLREWGHAFEELHELFANALLAAVLVHLALIVGTSVHQRRNAAQAMLSGRIDGAGPDLAQHNRAGLAALLLAAVLAFWAWQWQQTPGGLVPAGPWIVSAPDRDHREHREHRDHRDDDD
ncbi:MAG: cytochrome b/b6 domain-containing protein [Rubrivivax sp.]|nr:cytochrome b/b6 domain-containing protein [Rubrivivax sp.]